MQVRELGLKGLLEITVPRYHDDRGYFEEVFHHERFAQLGIEPNFVQDNLSFSKAGVLRGLHFQRAPQGQGKLVKVLSGAVLDVIVDIRPESSTFGQYEKVLLSAENGNLLYVPEGFAHGFEALADTVFLYKCTNLYSKACEGGIRYDDKQLGIVWETKNPIVSPKDIELPSFAAFCSSLGVAVGVKA